MDNRSLVKKGRKGDTKIRNVLGEKAHVNKTEAEWIDKMGIVGQMITAQEGSGTVNPETGLREYGWFGDFWDNTIGVDGLWGAATDLFSGDIGGFASGIWGIPGAVWDHTLGTEGLGQFVHGDQGFLQGDYPGSDKGWEKDQEMLELGQGQIDDLVAQFGQNVGEGGKYAQQTEFATEQWGGQQADYQFGSIGLDKTMDAQRGYAGVAGSGIIDQRQEYKQDQLNQQLDQSRLGYEKNIFDIEQAQTDEAWSVQAAINEIMSNTASSFSNLHSSVGGMDYSGFDIDDYTG